MGNLHFEGAMVFFMALFIWLILKMKWMGSALALAFSVGSKLLPLMFIPAILKYLDWKRGWKWMLIFCLGFLVLIIPFLDGGLIQNFGQSFDLYFRKFEFNASLYYLLREIGIWVTGYNQIAILGPSLAILTTISIALLALKIKKGDERWLLEILLISFCIYLLGSATVHPWYIILPVFLSVFTRFQFPLVWSLVVVLSYAHYWDSVYEEKYLLIFLEYCIVLFYFLFEHLKKERLLKSIPQINWTEKIKLKMKIISNMLSSL
ncbi:MAG: hypothetical protein R2769_10875 [Saprospiraceae bacterium]